jgi:uncharacterized protein YfcZ (UPF0381/DUF406 family)
MSPVDIEAIIDNGIDEIVATAFEEHFTTKKEIQHALDYLKERINSLETEDFEDLIED